MTQNTFKSLVSVTSNFSQEMMPIVNLKYCSEDNILKRPIYQSKLCLVEVETFKRLQAATTSLWNQGFKLVIWDAFRPIDVQKKMWQLLPDSHLVALPPEDEDKSNIVPSKYNGMELDLALANKDGKLLPMPSPYEDRSKASWLASHHVQSMEYKYGKVLKTALEDAGFTSQLFCWWKFKNEADPVVPYLDSSVYKFFE